MSELTKMDLLTTKMAEHICDNLCAYPKVTPNQEVLEDICANCKMGQFICDILNEYNHINDFEHTQCHKLLQKIAELESQLPHFDIGDTAYLVDFESKVIDASVVNGIVCRTDDGGVEFEYDSDLLKFHSDDIGVIVFKNQGEAQEVLEKKQRCRR